MRGGSYRPCHSLQELERREGGQWEYNKGVWDGTVCAKPARRLGLSGSPKLRGRKFETVLETFIDEYMYRFGVCISILSLQSSFPVASCN